MAYLIIFWLGYEGSVLTLAVDCDGSLPEHHSLQEYNCFVPKGFGQVCSRAS